MSGLVMPNGKPAKLQSPKETPQKESLPVPAHVTTAYVVAIDTDGSVALVPDMSIRFICEREPTAEDILGSSAVVQSKVNAQITAMSTQQAMLQQARAMAKQQQDAQAVQQMSGMNLRG